MTDKKNILVLQPLPGIGDLFWFDGACQSLSSFYKEPLTLMTKPQSHAQQIYKGIPYIKEVLWIDRPGSHSGFFGVIRLALFLRKKKISDVWIFHKSWRYRWACKLAGITHIFSYEKQEKILEKHPIQRVNLLLKKHRIPLLKDPKFFVSKEIKVRIEKKLVSHKKPWVAIGIGGTEPSKKWKAEHWENLAVWLFQVKKMSVFLLGGSLEKEEALQMVQHIQEKGGEAKALTSFSLQESLSFLEEVQFFVGNDTGMMNGAVVLNKPTFSLFLSSPPLSYRSSLMPICPKEGNKDILLSQVQEALNQFLESAK